MATSPWYREGTAQFTQGSATVKGTGTEWVKYVRAGDGIQGPDGKLYQITNVASDTSLSISPVYGGATQYWTIPVQGYVKHLADAAANLIRDFDGAADEALDAADRAKQSAIDAETQKNGATAEANRAAVEAGRSEAEADRSELEADRAQQAADNAVAVVTDGGGSIDPEAGKWPVAGAEGTIKQAWVHELEFALDKLRVATNKALYGNGPYPALDFQFQGANMLDPRIEFTRASKDWDLQGREYGVDEPVLTEDGLWVSGARTNLLVWSDDISGVGWGRTGAAYFTVTKFQATGLLEGINANKILIPNDTESTVSILVSQILSLETGKHYSFSFFVSKDFGSLRYTMIELGNGARSAFDASEGKMASLSENVVDSKVEDLGLWYRVRLEFTYNASAGRVGVSPRSDSAVTYNKSYFAGEYAIYSGFMLTEGVGDTTYIPTESSQVTVANSVTEMPVDDLQEATFYVSGVFGKPKGAFEDTIFALSKDGEAYTVAVELSHTPRLRSAISGYDQMNLSQVEYTGGSARVGLSIKNGEVTFCVNGFCATSPNPQVYDALITSRVLTPYRPSNIRGRGEYRAICVYNKALTPAQLQELTS